MSDFLATVAQGIADSALHDHIVQWLRTVPGLPPIVQAIHILSIAGIAASIVMIDLRVLGLAVPSQNLGEMITRLTPWMWGALATLFVSGAVFVIARPRRYFVNPVFGIKLILLFVALVLSVALLRRYRHSSADLTAKTLAALSLTAWLGVMLAGRWIAYADYLFSPE